MTKPKSEFEKWFIDQHGPRTECKEYTDKQLNDIVLAGDVANGELSERRLWDEKRQSALYAWRAKK